MADQLFDLYPFLSPSVSLLLTDLLTAVEFLLLLTEKRFTFLNPGITGLDPCGKTHVLRDLVLLMCCELFAAFFEFHQLTRKNLDHLCQMSGGRRIGLFPGRFAQQDEQFPQFKAEVEAQPENWRAWFRLGLAYDASGDRRRARAALRESIRLQRAEAKAGR